VKRFYWKIILCLEILLGIYAHIVSVTNNQFSVNVIKTSPNDLDTPLASPINLKVSEKFRTLIEKYFVLT
jgi:hypothetical protein